MKMLSEWAHMGGVAGGTARGTSKSREVEIYQAFCASCCKSHTSRMNITIRVDNSRRDAVLLNKHGADVRITELLQGSVITKVASTMHCCAFKSDENRDKIDDGPGCVERRDRLDGVVTSY